MTALVIAAAGVLAGIRPAGRGADETLWMFMAWATLAAVLILAVIPPPRASGCPPRLEPARAVVCHAGP
jgi:hypothetical protein